MDTADVLNGEGRDVINIPLHDPLKTITNPQHFNPAKSASDRGRSNNAINPGCRSATDKNGEFLPLAHSVISKDESSDRNK